MAIKVLVVDDSAVVRQTLTRELAKGRLLIRMLPATRLWSFVPM